MQVGPRHLDGRGRRGVVGAGAHQLDHLGAAVAGALDDGRDLVGRDELADGNAVDGAVTRHRHHGVAVPAQHHGAHVFHRHARSLREEELQPRGIEDAGHAHHPLGRKAGDLLHGVDHGIERIRDHDDEGVRAAGAQVLGHTAGDLEIDAEQIVARHAGLARHPGGHDDHVGACQIVPAGGAADGGVVAEHGAVLLEIERLALREPELLRDVEQPHVAQLLPGRQRRQLAPDVTGPNQGNLLPLCHTTPFWRHRCDRVRTRAARIL